MNAAVSGVAIRLPTTVGDRLRGEAGKVSGPLPKLDRAREPGQRSLDDADEDRAEDDDAEGPPQPALHELAASGRAPDAPSSPSVSSTGIGDREADVEVHPGNDQQDEPEDRDEAAEEGHPQDRVKPPRGVARAPDATRPASHVAVGHGLEAGARGDASRR